MWAYGHMEMFVAHNYNVSKFIPVHLLIGLKLALFVHFCTIYNKMLNNSNDIYQAIAEEAKGLFRQNYQQKFKKEPQLNETVISSISIYKKGQQKAKIVSLGFGTKSLPESIANEHKGKVIKDMHAEILARRGFIKYLIANMPQEGNDNWLFVWKKDKLKHKIREQYEIIMYTNEIFCGDCMVNESSNLFSGARPLKYFATDSDQVPQQKFSRHCLRTKPGRLDLPKDKRTLSLSCSDKIGTWNILGLQGKILFNFIIPIYLNRIIVQTQRQVDPKKLSQGINLSFRLQQLRNCTKQKVKIKLFKILVDGSLRSITTQFCCHEPQIVMLSSEEKHKTVVEEGKRFELCGIMACQQVSWLNGRTGLPEGVSLKKPGKISPFCSQRLYQNFKSKETEQFKYHAVKERIKLLFGEWTNDFRKPCLL